MQAPIPIHYVDGKLGIGDAYINSNWKTILASGMGAGAKGLFILDISNPDLSSESANSGSNKKVLWEKDGLSDANLGHIHGSPSIVKLPDGNWYAVTGNGYGSDNGDVILYLLNLSNGNVTTMKALSDSDNGLSAATLIDIDHDYDADFAYGGDLKGNLWRFDLSDLNSSPVKLVATGIDKPITTAPDVSFHPSGDFLIYFGTGALLSDSDSSDTAQQSIYAVWDRYSNINDSCASDLLCQSLSVSTHTSGTDTRIATQIAPDWSNHKGWRVDLPESGERLLAHPQLRAGRLEFISTNPAIPEVNSWLMNLDYLSGGDAEEILFDLNSNQTLDMGDLVSVASAQRTPVGIRMGSGYLSQPTIARLNDGHDILFVNGLTVEQGTTSVCTGYCEGGIALGHFDVDTDLVLDGSTNHHTHEYDDKHNVTFTDYFNLLDGGDLVTDAAVGIDASNQKLIAVIANADLSPGGELTIGNKQWNVVAYQKMVQQQLQSWDGISPLLDDAGDPLSFTLNQINSAVGGSGTLKISFNDLAIITGGLIPTKTGCVRSNSQPNGRWRNGALTIQLLDLNSINVAAANKGYVVQNPSDLLTSLMINSTIISLDDAGIKYGGILADSAVPSAFVYESTLFWHHKGACYGDSDWAADRDNSTLTDTEYKQFLIDLDALVSGEIAALKSYVCLDYDNKKQTCKDKAYEQLLTTISEAVNSLLPDYFSDLSFLTAIQGQVGEPTTSVIDSTQTITPVLGPIPLKGRVSWIDLRR